MDEKIKEVIEKCARAEKAYALSGAPGKPSFIIVGKKPKDKFAKKAEVVPNLYGEVLLSGHRKTPTIVILKCEDVRNFLIKQEIIEKTNETIEKFRKRIGDL